MAIRLSRWVRQVRTKVYLFTLGLTIALSPLIFGSTCAASGG
jgi:hypothetical protein